MDLRSSNIVVTGGSSGLGKATAKALVEAGARVVITGRDESRLKRAELETGAIGVRFDIADYSSIPEKSAEILRHLEGRVDALINNAGIGTFSLLGDITVEQFEKVFATNIFGLTMYTQEVVQNFKEFGQGTIVNIASTASQKGFPRGSVYAASKFALRGLTQCWQTELRKDNIRVIQVNPSEVPTAFATEDGEERPEEESKLTPREIAHSIKAALEMDNRGFITELTVWATNPK